MDVVMDAPGCTRSDSGKTEGIQVEFSDRI